MNKKPELKGHQCSSSMNCRAIELESRIEELEAENKELEATLFRVRKANDLNYASANCAADRGHGAIALELKMACREIREAIDGPLEKDDG